MQRRNTQQEKKRQVEIILKVASNNLSKNVKEVQERQEADYASSGHIHYLVDALAETFLTQEQQKQISAIIEMHKRCLYPGAYASKDVGAN